jgi:RimJ/RimL family protein N-acetyltransferase
MTFCLESRRLFIRQFRDSDLETFLAYRNDPQVAKYQAWNVPYPRARGMEFVEFMTVAFPAVQGEWFQAALELKSTHETIGDVGFIISRENGRQAVIGYSLARAYWGNGYAYEAVSRLLVYLFANLNLRRIIAECDVENTASWRLLERLGFSRESQLLENIFFKGSYGSEYHYAMRARKWRERPGPRRSEMEAA